MPSLDFLHRPRGRGIRRGRRFPRMRPGIFADSRDVMLRNDVLNALQRYDARETQQTLRRLSDDYADDDGVPN
jgi:hypothetical protein